MRVLPGRRQSGTLDLLEIGIVVLSSTTKRRGQRRFSCLVGSKGSVVAKSENVPETCHENPFCAHLAHLAFSRSQYVTCFRCLICSNLTRSTKTFQTLTATLLVKTLLAGVQLESKTHLMHGRPWAPCGT